MTPSRVHDTVVDKVAELLHLRIGLRPDQSLRGRLRRAIHDEATRHDKGHDSYVESLADDAVALQSLMNRVTVQETGFFRHPEQFAALVRDVLPGLDRPVRLWSAGCANGQEAYTLAMLLQEHKIDGSIVATDLSTAALQRTAQAQYHRRELSGLSETRLAQHFTRVGNQWELNADVRDRVSILRHNLLDPLPAEVHDAQVVFCRNVLIYLSSDQVRLFLDRIADTLAPSTTLFVGAAETIWQTSDRFKAVHVGDAFLYRQLRGEQGNPRGQEQAQPQAARTGSRRTAVSTPRGARRVAERKRAAGPQAPPPRPDTSLQAALEKVGQDAVALGDYHSAVVAFRKCAYLNPQDPLAQLHLGLALEAIGDDRSAKRAFAAARQALVEAGADHGREGLEGYSTAEILRLLDSKR